MQLLSDNLVTPNEIFFIRNHLPVPDIDENNYKLEITGEGINTVTLSLEVILSRVNINKQFHEPLVNYRYLPYYRKITLVLINVF